MKTTLKVTGMSCTHCVAAVKGALEELNGVKFADVSLEAGTAEVEYDDGMVQPSEMKAAIEEQGFDAE